jgi:hypothetical protein
LLKCERWRECEGAIKKIERRKGERLRKQERWNVCKKENENKKERWRLGE